MTRSMYAEFGDLVEVSADEYDQIAIEYANRAVERIPKDRISYSYFRDDEAMRLAFIEAFSETVGKKYRVLPTAADQSFEPPYQAPPRPW